MMAADLILHYTHIIHTENKWCQIYPSCILWNMPSQHNKHLLCILFVHLPMDSIQAQSCRVNIISAITWDWSFFEAPDSVMLQVHVPSSMIQFSLHTHFGKKAFSAYISQICLKYFAHKCEKLLKNIFFMIRPSNKDFRARRYSDLILQKAAPGLCFNTVLWQSRVQWAALRANCAFAPANSRPVHDYFVHLHFFFPIG